MAEPFDARHADKLENPERLAELPPAKLVELLRLGGAEFARMDRPVGLYHNVIVAQRPQR